VKISGEGEERKLLAVTIVALDAATCAVVLNDITKVVEREKKLFVQEQRFRAVVDALSGYAIFTADVEGNVDEWNLSLERFTDLGADNVVGQPLGKLVEASARSVDAGLFDEARRLGGVKFEGTVRSTANVTRWTEGLLSSLVDAEGEANGFGIVLHDTTAQREHERLLVTLATTDPLTGLLNRRSFSDAAERELKRHVRYERPLSVIMIDIDHFKRVNDTYGHAVGDLVISAVVERCRRCVRDVDLVARLGGEEFAVLAPETSGANAAILAERLRAVACSAPVATPAGLVEVTVSLGVASLRESGGDTLGAMLERADVGLYAAKRGGRNRVVLEP
jgi:diguanylate cyclase (GGDEF)-like protein/PAS domain S-box-containing protein